MCDRLRADPGSLGLVSSLGGYLAKHAHAIYSTQPPRAGFQYANTGNELAKLPTRQVIEQYVGPARVESYTIGFDSKQRATTSQPKLFAACRTPDAKRVWGTTTDSDLLAAAQTEELCGRNVQIGTDHVLELR